MLVPAVEEALPSRDKLRFLYLLGELSPDFRRRGVAGHQGWHGAQRPDGARSTSRRHGPVGPGQQGEPAEQVDRRRQIRRWPGGLGSGPSLRSHLAPTSGDRRCQLCRCPCLHDRRHQSYPRAGNCGVPGMQTQQIVAVSEDGEPDNQPPEMMHDQAGVSLTRSPAHTYDAADVP